MRSSATGDEIAAVRRRAEGLGLKCHPLEGGEQAIIGLRGDVTQLDPLSWLALPGVQRAVRVAEPYMLASRATRDQPTRVVLDAKTVVGAGGCTIIAGPCSVESREQIIEAALAVKEAGASALRGGAFKPRTSPYSFQGLGAKGLELLVEARERSGLPVVTEVMAVDQLELVARHADVLQIGSRNMQNFSLLRAVGELRKPVLLKRGMMSTLDELLMSAEYLLASGNPNVMLCERGIRTFETSTRNTFDINAIPVLKRRTHLPVLADPSHSTGHWELVSPVARAAVAAGADGLLVEVHPDPPRALSDGAQSLKPEALAALVREVRALVTALRSAGDAEVEPRRTSSARVA